MYCERTKEERCTEKLLKFILEEKRDRSSLCLKGST